MDSLLSRLDYGAIAPAACVGTTHRMDIGPAKQFYEKQYQGREYAPEDVAAEHFQSEELNAFLDRYQLRDRRCLEVGCGRGAFQYLVGDYTGTDLAESVRPYLHKPFFAGSATDLPFADGEFDVVWSVAVLEHVPGPERALQEMRRVLKDGGFLYLAPAWQCRPWAAQGYPVRPYRDFNWRGKLIKASIPIRDSVWFRSLHIGPRRVRRLLGWALRRRPTTFTYRELQPNYTHYWLSDSDAVNSMDPYEAILWFVSRGDACLSHPTWTRQFLVRTGALIFRIRKSAVS